MKEHAQSYRGSPPWAIIDPIVKRRKVSFEKLSSLLKVTELVSK